MSREAKLVVDELINAMQSRPDDFRIGEHTLDDMKTGMQFWIANGVGHGSVYKPYRMEFGWWQSRRFHRAVTAFKACRTAAALMNAQHPNRLKPAEDTP